MGILITYAHSLFFFWWWDKSAAMFQWEKLLRTIWGRNISPDCYLLESRRWAHQNLQKDVSGLKISPGIRVKHCYEITNVLDGTKENIVWKPEDINKYYMKNWHLKMKKFRNILTNLFCLNIFSYVCRRVIYDKNLSKRDVSVNIT